MEFFCFECGITFEVYGKNDQPATVTTVDSCDCNLLESLGHMSINPVNNGDLDLSLFYPPNFALITDDLETLYTMIDGEEKFYSLA
jgi:hypothetical protein